MLTTQLAYTDCLQTSTDHVVRWSDWLTTFQMVQKPSGLSWKDVFFISVFERMVNVIIWCQVCISVPCITAQLLSGGLEGLCNQVMACCWAVVLSVCVCFARRFVLASPASLRGSRQDGVLISHSSPVRPGIPEAEGGDGVAVGVKWWKGE